MRSTKPTLLLGLGAGLIVAAMVLTLYHAVVPGPEAAGAAALGPQGAPDASLADAAQPGAGNVQALDQATGGGTFGAGTVSEPAPVPPRDGGSAVTPDAAPADGGDGPSQPMSSVRSGAVTVAVPRGATATEISQLLAEAGAVPDADFFLELVRQRDAARRLKEGAYTFLSGESPAAILERLLEQIVLPPER